MMIDLSNIESNSKMHFDKIYLVINSSVTKIETKSKLISRSSDIQIENQRIVKYAKEFHWSSEFLNFNIISHEIINESQKIVHFLYEYVDRKILNKIISSLKFQDIIVDSVISSTKLDTIIPKLEYNRNTKLDSKNIVKLDIKDNYTLLSFFNGEKLISVKHIDIGLNLIYNSIQNLFGCELKKSKDLFTLYGNIPPKNIRNNSIIYSNTNYTNIENFYTKIDLSHCITNNLNIILNHVKEAILLMDRNFISKHTIILISDLINTVGIKDYLEFYFNSEIIVNIQKIMGINYSDTIKIANLQEIFLFEKHKNNLELKKLVEMKTEAKFNVLLNMLGLNKRNNI